jgi:hypothetical protein
VITSRIKLDKGYIFFNNVSELINIVYGGSMDSSGITLH